MIWDRFGDSFWDEKNSIEFHPRVLAHIEAGNLTLKESLEMLVIDEADLIFSFGHEDDVKGILAALPNIYQSVLTSATLSDDVARY